MSRIEVIYKVLKQQLREYQSKLIKMKEEEKHQRKEAAKSREKSPHKSGLSRGELKTFARYLKHFQLYGWHRDMNPELKRIVDNLSCQRHSFMYCPCCKNYEEIDFDPVDNIKKFMEYVRKEKERIEKRARKRKAQSKKAAPKLPEDSVSEITDLEQDEILYKYYDEHMTEAERYKKDRKETKARLYTQK